jgi:hypothetical protein
MWRVTVVNFVQSSLQQGATVKGNSEGFAMKLYQSAKHQAQWFAFGPEVGWVMFPAEIGGWARRQTARGIDPLYLREVPLRMGFNTGIPGAPASSDGAAPLQCTGAAVLVQSHFEPQKRKRMKNSLIARASS